MIIAGENAPVNGARTRRDKTYSGKFWWRFAQNCNENKKTGIHIILKSPETGFSFFENRFRWTEKYRPPRTRFSQNCLTFEIMTPPEGRGVESHRLRKWKHRWYLIPTDWMSTVFFLLIPHLSGFWWTFNFDIWALFQKTPKTDTKRYITSIFEPLGSNITHISYPIIQSKVKVLRLHSSTFSFRSLLISAESPLRSTSR